MSEELTLDQKIRMVRDAKPSYAKNELVETYRDTGRIINEDRRQKAREELMQSTLFEKSTGTKLDLHNPNRIVPTDEGTGSDFRHPFRLEKAVSGNDSGWKLSSWGSSITDGTNGGALDITGLDDFRQTDGDVWIQVDIMDDLTVSSLQGANVMVEVGGYADEVDFDEDGIQTHANLFIGRVFVADGVYSFSQAINNAQLLTHGLVNGSAVRVFDSHTIHPTIIEAP